MHDGDTPAGDWYANDRATFGDRLADARAAMGLGQEELAHRIGVRAKTLRGWEEDKAEPRANRLQMLAGVLNVSISWLLTGQGEGLTSPDAARTVPGDVAAILAEMRQLRGEIARGLERLAALENRLGAALRDSTR